MTPTGNRKRHTKKMEVIDLSDDESDGNQPSAKRQSLRAPSPPAPSPKEVELQEKVAKLEDMYEKAVKAAADAESARNQAESLLESKRGILSNEKIDLEIEIKKRLAEVSKQLEESRKSAKASFARQMLIASENDTLKIEKTTDKLMKDLLTKEVLELKGEVKETRRIIEEQNSEKDILKGELADIKEQLTAAAKQRNYLSDENSTLREQAKVSKRAGENADKLKGELTAIKEELKATAKERDALREKLVQCNGQQPEQQKSSAKTNNFIETQDDSIRSMDQMDNKSIDLFQQGLLLSNQTISFDEARKKIKDKFDSSGILNWWKVASKESQSCNVCIAKLESPHNVVNHFLSRGHATEMKDRGGAVSLVAVDYWMKKIDEAAGRYEESAILYDCVRDGNEEERIDEGQDSDDGTDESGEESEKDNEDELNDEEEEEMMQVKEQKGKTINIVAPFAETAEMSNLLETQDDSIPSMDQIDNESIDLFQQGLALSSKVISLDDARTKIKDHLAACRNLVWSGIESVRISCIPCGKSPARASHVICHFIAEGHEKKTKNNGVSLAAIDYWKRKIDEAAAAAAPKVAASTAAVAASPASKGSIDEGKDSDEESDESTGAEEGVSDEEEGELDDEEDEE